MRLNEFENLIYKKGYSHVYETIIDLFKKEKLNNLNYSYVFERWLNNENVPNLKDYSIAYFLFYHLKKELLSN